MENFVTKIALIPMVKKKDSERNVEATGSTVKSKGGSVKTIPTPDNIWAVREAIEKNGVDIGLGDVILSLLACTKPASNASYTVLFVFIPTKSKLPISVLYQRASGCCRSDRKRSDGIGMTLIPWKRVLEKTNARSVAYFVNSELKVLFSNGVKDKRVMLVYNVTAPYLIMTGKLLKIHKLE
ncbi:hypothetical protein C0J52_21460 [Blattella germanica]|nr:hypothetical protein C0J52_21460 [Blattella germanica]